VHAIITDLLVHAIPLEKIRARITRLVPPIVLKEPTLKFAHSTLFESEARSPQ